jgi:uncharacterized protein YceH (UPF0502 family)
MDSPSPSLSADETPLSALEARVLGCLIEKEFATPGIYPLTLNSLVAACNQRSNRSPVLAVESREVEIAVEQLRHRRLVAHFTGAEARVAKFKQTLDLIYPVPPEARALLAELLLRGPQTTAALRANSERLVALPELAEVEQLLVDLASRETAPLTRKLPRSPGRKEPRWAQLLTGEPAPDDAQASGATQAEPLTVRLTLPPEAEQRIATLEAEVARLGAELLRLRSALGE